MFFLYWSFTQNCLAKEIIYGLFKIQLTHSHYFVGGANNTPLCEASSFFFFEYYDISDMGVEMNGNISLHFVDDTS